MILCLLINKNVSFHAFFYVGSLSVFPVSHTLLFYIARENAIFVPRISAKNVMSIKRFIDRPLLSIVINVMVVAVGIISLPPMSTMEHWRQFCIEDMRATEKNFFSK